MRPRESPVRTRSPLDRKKEQVERYLKQMKHLRTQEERKELDRRSAARKAQRHKGKRRERRDWVEHADETFEHERMGRGPRGPVRVGAPDGTSALDTQGQRGGRQGQVVAVARDSIVVRLDGEDLRAGLVGRLGREHGHDVVVGDEVWVDESGELPRAYASLPRRSWLARADQSRPGGERVIAANVDVALLVVALRRPDFRPRLIDRAFVLCRRGGVALCVCASKVDLVESRAERAELEAHLALYRALEVEAVLTSTETGEGLDALREVLRGKTAVFFGQSGVGKSSLMNALGGLGLRTGDVRSSDGKGRHTTTSSSLHAFDGGTRVIDTPGVRSLGLDGVEPRHVLEAFPELQAAGCRFRDCLHRGEPGCGVPGAVGEGRIAAFRLDAYYRILASLDEEPR